MQSLLDVFKWPALSRLYIYLLFVAILLVLAEYIYVAYIAAYMVEFIEFVMIFSFGFGYVSIDMSMNFVIYTLFFVLGDYK